MTVLYTTNLGLGQPVTGTESGTWGDDVNNSVTSYLDIAISGTLALTSASFTANALTLSNTLGDSSATNIGPTTAQHYVLRVSSLAANVTITAPSVSKTYLIINSDATYYVVIKSSSGTGTSIAPGERATVYYNSATTDYIKVTSSIVSNLNGVLPVANGGTGVTTSTGSGSTVLSTNPTLVGITSTGDVTVYRAGAPTTGVLYLGNSTARYLYYDGTGYNLNGASLTVGGNVTAYSDERIKTNWRGLDADFIARLAQVKSGIYDRTDIEETQVGVSAQSLQTVLPNAVIADKEGILSVSYGNAALAACVELAKRVVDLEARLAALEG